MSHGTSHGRLTDVVLVFWGSHLHFGFAFAICDMIGHGMTCGDVMMNYFAFSHESHWDVTKSVVFLESH